MINSFVQSYQRPINNNQLMMKDNTGAPLYTLTNTSLTQNKYNSTGRANSDLRQGGRMGLSSGQGNNLKAGANSLIGSNGPMNKRAPSTGRNGVNFDGQEIQNDAFYKNNKRAQSLERAAAVHSSGNPGLNSLGRGNPINALDSFT